MIKYFKLVTIFIIPCFILMGFSLFYTSANTSAAYKNIDHNTDTNSNIDAAGDFALLATPGSQMIEAGDSTAFSISAQSINNFDQPINLTASFSQPVQNIQLRFSTIKINAGGSSILTVITNSMQAAGNYTITVTGTSGNLTHKISIDLTINAPVNGDFILTASPDTQSVDAGGATLFFINSQAVDNFAEKISLIAVINTPNNTITTNLSSNIIDANGGVLLTVSTTAQELPGTYNITITGISGQRVHSAAISLTVTKAPVMDFALSLNANVQTISAGDMAILNLDAQSINGFNQSIDLSAIVMPASNSVELNFSNTNIIAGSSTTITLHTKPFTTGPLTIVITGVSNQLVRVATATINIIDNANGIAAPFTFSTAKPVITAFNNSNMRITAASNAEDFDNSGVRNDIALYDQKQHMLYTLLNVGSSSAMMGSTSLADLISNDAQIVSFTTLIDFNTGFNSLILAVQSGSSSQLLIGINDGTGIFSEFRQLTGNGGKGLLKADINLDTFDDLFYFNNNNDAVVQLNDGTNNFLDPITSSAFPNLRSIATAVSDVNDDDFLDIVVLAQDPNNNNQSLVYVMVGQGDGNLIASDHFTPVPGTALSIVGGLAKVEPNIISSNIVDFNGDAFADFAVVSTQGGILDHSNASVSLLFNRPLSNGDFTFSVQTIDLIDKQSGSKLLLDGRFNGPGQLTNNFNSATDIIAVGDFNADGSSDLIVNGTTIINGTNFRSALYLSGNRALGIMRVAGMQRTAQYASSSTKLDTNIDGNDTFISCVVGEFTAFTNQLPDVLHISLNGSLWLDSNTSIKNFAPLITIDRNDLNVPFGNGRKEFLDTFQAVSVRVNGFDFEGDTISYAQPRILMSKVASSLPEIKLFDNGDGSADIIINPATINAHQLDPLSLIVLVSAHDSSGNVAQTAFTLVIQTTMVQSITPDNGPVGSIVTINGQGLSIIQSVRFNGLLANIIDINDQQINVVVPDGATTGFISLSTTNIGSINFSSTSTLLTQFNVTSPVLTSFAPNSGPAGTAIKITGKGFNDAISVIFNGIDAKFTIDGDQYITAIVPDNASSGPIAVITSLATATNAINFFNNFIVVDNKRAPTFNNFMPKFGVAGKTMIINGNNFNNVQAVQLNGIDLKFKSISSTLLTAIVPDNATTDLISVITNEGAASSSELFTFVPKFTHERAIINEIFFSNKINNSDLLINIVATNLANSSKVFLVRDNAGGSVRQELNIEAFDTDALGNLVAIVRLASPIITGDLFIEIDNGNGQISRRYKLSIADGLPARLPQGR